MSTGTPSAADTLATQGVGWTTAPSNLWLVLTGDTLSVQTTKPKAGWSQQIAKVGDTVDSMYRQLAAALVNSPNNATIPANLRVPGLGNVPIGTSNPISTVLGTGQNLITGGVSGAAGSPTQTPGQSIASTGIAQTLSDIWSWITNASHWLKVLEAIGGAVAIYLAIKSLTGVETPKISLARAAAR